MSTHRLPELCLITEDESFIGDHIPVNLPINNKFSVSYARSESRQNSILGAVPSPHQEHMTLSSSDGEPQTSDGESADDDPSAFFQAVPSLSPTLPTYHSSTRSSETVKKPPLPYSRTLSMPLPSQLSHLQNPHRLERPNPNLYHSAPLVPSVQSSRVREVSLELADSIQMVVQTMLQISPPQVLDPAKERFSACSLSVPTSSMSAMFTAIKNINYLSANMLSFCEQPGLLSGECPPPKEHAANTTMHNEFDIGEMLQCLGDALSGAAAQVGVDLVLYHGNIGLKQVYVSGDESAISFALSHIVRQVLNTAERGDTVELGLLLEQEAHSLPIDSSSSSKPDFAPIENASSLEDVSLKCIIRISHKYAPSETHQGENHPRDVVTTEIRPKLSFDTLFLRRILRQIDGKLVSDLPPPELFTSGRTCDLHIALQRLPMPSSTPVAELTDEEAEPSLEQLASFGESLKGKRVTLYASADGSFAHHLTIYLMAWGMDVTHVSPEGQVDGLVDPPTPSPYEPRSPYSPSAGGLLESGFSFGASGKVDAQAGSQSPSFIFIDDDIDILKDRIQSLSLNQHPQPPASFGSRKRPSLSVHHRPRSSPQLVRLMGLNNAYKQSARVVIMHFTSLGNYKLLKDVMQSIMASYATTGSLLPEVMIIPKPAGPRRFLTALHTAVTKPTVDPFFLPIATSPVSPGAPLSTGSPTSEHGSPNNNGGSPQSQSPTPKHSSRPHGSRSNSDRSARSGDNVNKSLASVLPSPLALPDNVEYFSAATQRLGSSPSSGLVIQSPDGQPAGIYFHPRSKTSRTASSQSMERDRGQLSIPNPRRASTSRTASGCKKDDPLTVSSVLPMADNEITFSPFSSGKQLSSMSALSREIQSQISPSILSPVPRKLSNASRRASSPSMSPPDATPSRRGLGKRPAAESKDSLAYLAPSKQRGKVLASDTNVVPPISVLIVDDNPINQTILSTFMKRKKIKYDLASNGQEAVQKWRTGEFHLILMDIQMPVMDGIQATKEIRRMEKSNAKAGYPPFTPTTEAHTPSDTSADSTASSVSSTETRASSSPYRSSVIIVALTASSLQTDRVAALAAGCNDFLTKPVSLLWLNNKIIEWGSIKALQMWADIRPDAMKSMTSGQAAQARNIADRLHVPPKGRKTPSPTRRSTSVMEDNAAALALACSAGTILQRRGSNMANVQFSPSSSIFETPDGVQSISPLQRSISDSSSGMPDVLGSMTSLSRISAESTDMSDGKDTPKQETQAQLSPVHHTSLSEPQLHLESQASISIQATPHCQLSDNTTTPSNPEKIQAQQNGYIQEDLSTCSKVVPSTETFP